MMKWKFFTYSITQTESASSGFEIVWGKKKRAESLTMRMKVLELISFILLTVWGNNQELRSDLDKVYTTESIYRLKTTRESSLFNPVVIFTSYVGNVEGRIDSNNPHEYLTCYSCGYNYLLMVSNKMKFLSNFFQHPVITAWSTNDRVSQLSKESRN